MGCRMHLALWLAVGLAPITVSRVQAEPIVPSLTLAPEVGRTEKTPARIDELDRALESFRRREYDQTLDLLEAATKKHATLPPARLMLARLFLSNNQVRQGRAALEQVVVEHPEYPGIYTCFGTLALTESRLTDAAL